MICDTLRSSAVACFRIASRNSTGTFAPITTIGCLFCVFSIALVILNPKGKPSQSIKPIKRCEHMNNLLTFRVAVLQGKKVIVVGSKISQSELDAFQAICDREDRSMSYVLRELAVRGLAYYYADGQLKTTPAEDDLISKSRSHDETIPVPVQTDGILNVEEVIPIRKRRAK